MTDALQSVILAAGKGTRMRSDRPKVLHELSGRPLLAWVLDAARGAGSRRQVVVVGHQADRVRAAVSGDDLAFVLQEPQLGTGHAVQCAASALRPDGWTLVLAGDVPLLRADTLRALATAARDAGAAAVVLTAVVDDAGASGRSVKDAAGRLQRIVEARDATPAELAIGEYNTGVFCFRTPDLLAVLDRLDTDNDQGEYYLTDTIELLVRDGRPVATLTVDDPAETVGINTVAELAAAQRLLDSRGGK